MKIIKPLYDIVVNSSLGPFGSSYEIGKLVQVAGATNRDMLLTEKYSGLGLYDTLEYDFIKVLNPMWFNRSFAQKV
jgi:hypothetical protein